MTTENRQNSQPESKPADWQTGEHGRRPLPLWGYAALIGAYGVSLGGLMSWAKENDLLLEDVPAADAVLLGIGAHRLARMATKDRISTVLRRPFTVYQGTMHALPGEVEEAARRDHGQIRQALGELFTCPYCMSTWSVTALYAAYLADRKLGRTLGALLATVSIADIMQSAYTHAVKH